MNKFSFVKPITFMLMLFYCSASVVHAGSEWKNFDEVSKRTGRKSYKAISDIVDYKAALGCKYNGGIVLAFLFSKLQKNGYALIGYQIDKNQAGLVHAELKGNNAYVLYPPTELVEQMKSGSVMKVVAARSKKNRIIVDFNLNGFSDSWLWMTQKCVM